MYRSLIIFQCHWSSFPSSSQHKMVQPSQKMAKASHIIQKNEKCHDIVQKTPDFGRKPDSPWPFLGLDPRWLPRVVDPGPGITGDHLGLRTQVSGVATCLAIHLKDAPNGPGLGGLVDPNGAARNMVYICLYMVCHGSHIPSRNTK